MRQWRQSWYPNAPDLIMAQDLLQKSQRSEMQSLAKNILSSQQAEIKQMQQWRKDWYGY